jgi:hypothetical protein
MVFLRDVNLKQLDMSLRRQRAHGNPFQNDDAPTPLVLLEISQQKTVGG